MNINGRTVLVCNCQGTMPLDGPALARACRAGLDGVTGDDAVVASQLCRGELARFQAALDDGPLLVACTQEAPLFDETAGESRGGPADRPADIRYANIRERAGWSDEAADAHPKIAALLAEAALPRPPVATVTLRSQGVVLIYGRDELAIAAARQLVDKLDITVLLSRPGEVLPPRTTDFPVLKGTIRRATGHLGAFEVEVDDYAAPLPSSRRALAFGPARNGARSRCDVILDLSGGTPLFASRRDGYLRADPGSPVAVQKAIFQAGDLVGEFEKPRHAEINAGLCAHSRNRRIGCTRCLDVCPTGAIASAGDAVAIDAAICAGCGACASVCPTGAATYAALPADHLFQRLRTLLRTYHAAGGRQPVLLVHDPDHGASLIDLLARCGDGLPARVIPLAVEAVTRLDPGFLAAAFAYGAADVRVLVPVRPREDLAPLLRQIDMIGAVLDGLGYGDGRLGLIEADDPDALGGGLRTLPRRGMDGKAPRFFLPLGDARGLTRLALRELQAAAPVSADILPLAVGAPFGRVRLDADGCSLCLACIQVCPTGALSGDPERPTVRFTEDACVQCGLCRNTCPERVITLEPRLNFTGDARRPVLLKQEDPYPCIRCGKPFGTRASIERIIARLEAGRHWMFAETPGMFDRVRMCGDCRAVVQTRSGLDPHAGPARPMPRVTDDYRR